MERWTERARPESDATVDSEPGGSESTVPEPSLASEEIRRRLASVNDFFWTVEVAPGGEMTLVHLSTNPPGVLGQDMGPAVVHDALGLRDRVAHADDAAVVEAFTSAIRAEEPAEVEQRLVGHQGVVQWTWSRGSPRREGDRLFFDGITTNIAEPRDLAAQRALMQQREREQQATIEEVQRTRDDFVALAGHELRTPLTVIQGYAEHLLDDPTMGPDQRAQLEVVVRRARSMSDLIDDLFDLAKLDAPLSSIAFTQVRLDDLVEESVRTLEPSARDRDITLQVVTVPVEVIGDHGRLRRMCDNVVENAVKYSPAGGTVTVTLVTEGDVALVRVADQGIGIPPDELSRIFERLYRASNVVDLRYPGTGLGLSITLATAVSHGGTAFATNAVDGGAVVTIRLPVAGPTDAGNLPGPVPTP